ncbi:hypothetical protein MKW98_004317 [Papaver atlanticum]|uniref:UBC core domain-containing protein n=1 Tax=Papaver atlanticum TaxID=357466 RepID=A0AAD4XSL1_9MAGN|nr:hypothetical protein MKW98_004317 [Papaver atlanticum]
MDSNEKIKDEETIEIRIEGAKFKQFDIIEEASSFSDHHYYNRPPKNYSDQLRNKISEEWDILKERLPNSILVRANRERPDLLRAVIIGSQGSTYHDGLFFFDIQFPSKYPNIPPKIHYCCFDVISMNRHIAYAISLEALPRKNIPLSSSTSTVLGLLLLYHRILDHTANTREPAAFFDEQIYKSNWKTMVSVLNKPPKCFEEYVAQHFHDRAEAILTTCKAYISWRVDAVDLSVPSQETFAELESIYYKLVIAFEKNGSSLENLYKLRIDFNGKPACSMRTSIAFGITTCLIIINIVLLLYYG